MAVICSYCEGPTVYDPDTSATVCTACGRENSVDYFTSVPSFNPNEASAFIPTDFTYHQRKRYHAETLITDTCTRLGLSSYAHETTALISDLTSDAFGLGDWFSVLAAAAAYVVSRRHSLPISIHQAADAGGCDERQIGRMVFRIIQFLGSGQLPGFDAAGALAHAIRACPSFEEVEEEKKEELIARGRFLIQCMTKWFLMTGRRPMPAVAAVAAFVAEMSGVEVSLEDIAKDIFTVASTSRVRHRELRETLVKAASALLPWGKDVNLKNLLYHMPVLIRVLEMNARRKKKKLENSEVQEFNLDEYLTIYSNAGDEEDSGYFRAGCDSGGVSCEELSTVEISEERLLSAYKNALDRIVEVRKSGQLEGEQGKKKRLRRELDYNGSWHSWEGTDFGKKLSLEQVLERDVGYDPLPPAFVNNMLSREKRRLKIDAAKRRIKRIMDPTSTADTTIPAEEEERTQNPKLGEKNKRKRKVGMGGIDWEDCIIELLLLHRVGENEIEDGQYNRLLDLHVFNSLRQ